MAQIVPISRCAVAVRAATLDDLPFMDGLQKKHSRQLGYFPTKQFEQYIAMGGVLIGEEPPPSPPTDRCAVTSANGGGLGRGKPVGYVISRDRYLKRDELGIIFQLCVAPGQQRKLVGAALVRDVFARSAYGCRLYCCWCAQDLEANHFWESLGFLPIAFRAGSTGKRRVHIFWQRRTHDGDTTTPYWYPCQTNAGAIREDRIVFPIPPGTHWSEVKAVVLPGEERVSGEEKKRVSGVGCLVSGEDKRRLPGSSRNPKPDTRNPPRRSSRNPKLDTRNPTAGKVAIVVGGRIKYIDRPGYVAPKAPEPPAAPKPRKPRPKAKNDPKLIAAARELRDRWLEHVNAPGRASSLLGAGKYEVSRAALQGHSMPTRAGRRALPAPPKAA